MGDNGPVNPMEPFYNVYMRRIIKLQLLIIPQFRQLYLKNVGGEGKKRANQVTSVPGRFALSEGQEGGYALHQIQTCLIK